MITIENAGFEKPSDHTFVWVCEQGIQPKKMLTTNCHVPEGWHFWWEHAADLHLPEMKPASPDRVFSGKAIQYFKSNDQYHAGLYQQIAVESKFMTIYLASRELWGFLNNDSVWDEVTAELQNNQLTLRAYCQAWSNHSNKDAIPGHESCVGDPECSWGAGTADYFIRLQDAPDLNGDPWNDAIQNIAFRVGIDPTGDTNPLADTVQWGEWWISYNEHHQISHTVPVEQEYDTVPYEVTVHMPYQVAGDLELSKGIYDRTYHIARETLGTMAPSADDTGRLTNVICPSGYGGKAILYDVPEGLKPSFEAYFYELYPKSRVSFVSTELSPLDPWLSYLLIQGDPEWADYVYAMGECYTMKSQGCFVTCCAMAQRIFHIKEDATPVTVDQTIGSDGYTSCRLLWSAMPLLGLEIIKATTNKQEAIDHLANGGLLFIEVEPNDLNHFVVSPEYAPEYSGDDFIILDPWKGKVDYLSNLYSGAESFRLVKEIESTPPPTPPEPEGLELTGLHLQHWEPGADRYYSHTTNSDVAPIAKVFSPEHALNVLRCNPAANVIVRQHVEHQHPYVFPEDGNYNLAAERWVDQMRDSLYRVCDQIAAEFPGKEEPYLIYESVNEEYENVNTDKNIAAASIDAAVAREVYNTGYPMRAGIFCAAVGNPDITQYDIVRNLAYATKDYEPWWGYHGYFLRNMDYGGPLHLWEYLAGRFGEFDRLLRLDGYSVPWYFGEGGVIGGRSSPPEPFAAINDIKLQVLTGEKDRIVYIPLHDIQASSHKQADDGWVAMYPNDGWRHPGVYDGDWMAHQEDNEILQAACLDTGADFRGSTLFTSCPTFANWKDFRITSVEITMMTEV